MASTAYKKNQGFFLNLGQDNIFCFYTLKRKAFDVSGVPLVSGTEVCVKRQLNSKWHRTGVHNLFAVAGRITFIFMNYGRQPVQDIFIFCISSVLLQHTEPSPLPHVCLAVFLQRTFIQQKIV